MKYSLYTIILALMVSACSASPAYKAARSSGYGYQENAISEDRYRISFKARGDNRVKTMNYALRRAAEVTLLQGYDWFVIVDRETLVGRETDIPRSSISMSSMRSSQVAVRDCGLLSCRTRYYPTREYGMEVHSDSHRDDVEAILEIRMGEGARPAAGDSYDAKAVMERLN